MLGIVIKLLDQRTAYSHSSLDDRLLQSNMLYP